MIYQIILNDIPNGSATSDSEDIQPNGGIKDGMSYQGNTTDVLMAGIGAILGAMENLADKAWGTNAKRNPAGLLFHLQGLSVNAAYTYGTNERDAIKTIVTVGLGEFIGGLMGFMKNNLVKSIPLRIFFLTNPLGWAITVATVVTYVSNTKFGKDTINWVSKWFNDTISQYFDTTKQVLQHNQNQYVYTDFTIHDVQAIVQNMLDGVSHSPSLEKRNQVRKESVENILTILDNVSTRESHAYMYGFRSTTISEHEEISFMLDTTNIESSMQEYQDRIIKHNQKKQKSHTTQSNNPAKSKGIKTNRVLMYTALGLLATWGIGYAISEAQKKKNEHVS